MSILWNNFRGQEERKGRKSFPALPPPPLPPQKPTPKATKTSQPMTSKNPLEFDSVWYRFMCQNGVRLCHCETFPLAWVLKIISAGFVPIHAPITLMLQSESWWVYYSHLVMRIHSLLIIYRVQVITAESQRAATGEFQLNWLIDQYQSCR